MPSVMLNFCRELILYQFEYTPKFYSKIPQFYMPTEYDNSRPGSLQIGEPFSAQMQTHGGILCTSTAMSAYVCPLPTDPGNAVIEIYLALPLPLGLDVDLHRFVLRARLAFSLSLVHRGRVAASPTPSFHRLRIFGGHIDLGTCSRLLSHRRVLLRTRSLGPVSSEGERSDGFKKRSWGKAESKNGRPPKKKRKSRQRIFIRITHDIHLPVLLRLPPAPSVRRAFRHDVTAPRALHDLVRLRVTRTRAPTLACGVRVRTRVPQTVAPITSAIPTPILLLDIPRKLLRRIRQNPTPKLALKNAQVGLWGFGAGRRHAWAGEALGLDTRCGGGCGEGRARLRRSGCRERGSKGGGSATVDAAADAEGWNAGGAASRDVCRDDDEADTFTRGSSPCSLSMSTSISSPMKHGCATGTHSTATTRSIARITQSLSPSSPPSACAARSLSFARCGCPDSGKAVEGAAAAVPEGAQAHSAPAPVPPSAYRILASCAMRWRWLGMGGMGSLRRKVTKKRTVREGCKQQSQIDAKTTKCDGMQYKKRESRVRAVFKEKKIEETKERYVKI
ncbi:hypothetical protein B0H13DRAFT_1909554 [Mycena leptocephala]|nr:hypothetical protein B0H13DRAFT_1909554 [Mycena leptocephala]